MNLPFSLVIFLSLFCALIVIISLFMLISFVLHERNEKKARKWQTLEHRWSDLTERVLSQKLPPEKLWEEVSHKEQLYFLDYLYNLAGDVSWRLRRSSRYQRLMMLAAPYLDPIRQRLNHKDEEMRCRAIDTLGKLAPYQHRAELHRALKDSESSVAFASFRALIYSYDVSDAELLVKSYARFNSFQPAYLSLLLSHLPPEETVVSLITYALQTKKSDWERIVALQTLERWQPQKEHTGALAVLAMASEESDVIRGLLLRVLLKWKATSVLPEVIFNFAESTSDYLRAYAMFSLGECEVPRREDLLKLGLTDSSRWVKLEAVQSLDYIENHEEARVTSSRRVSCSLLSHSQYRTSDEVFV